METQHNRPASAPRLGGSDDDRYERSLARSAEKGGKNIPLIIGGVLAAIVLIALGWFLLSGFNAGNGIDSGKYQAVFLTNGQVYFGKLKSAGNYYKLTEVYYLQSQQAEAQAGEDKGNPQQASTDQNANLQLIKLGQEIHGPEDEMFMEKSQLLFFENLKKDGKVSTKIEEYRNSKK